MNLFKVFKLLGGTLLMLDLLKISIQVWICYPIYNFTLEVFNLLVGKRKRRTITHTGIRPPFAIDEKVVLLN